MTGFLTLAAVVLLALVAPGVVRLLIGPSRLDRMMAAQLTGTGCAGIVLLLSAIGPAWIIDVAIVLAILAIMAVAALWRFDPGAKSAKASEMP